MTKYKSKVYASVLLIMILALVSSISACQNNPDEEIVKKKKDGNMMELINQTQPADSKIVIPDSYQDKIMSAKGDVTITLDALIENQIPKHILHISYGREIYQMNMQLKY